MERSIGRAVDMSEGHRTYCVVSFGRKIRAWKGLSSYEG